MRISTAKYSTVFYVNFGVKCRIRAKSILDSAQDDKTYDLQLLFNCPAPDLGTSKKSSWHDKGKNNFNNLYFQLKVHID